jgi:hypothetical protein
VSAGRAARLLLGLGLAGCAAPAADARATLLAFHDAQRRAHLERDADAMVALLAEGQIDVRDGVVRRPTRAETLARFERYFGAVEFLAWEDLEPPVITMSDDGTLATMVVQKLVRLRTADPAGGTRVERTLFAWLATCVRGDGGEWKVASVASTRRPVDAEASLAAQRHALGGAEALASVARVRATAHGSGPAGEYTLALDLAPDGPWKLEWRFPGRAPTVFEVHGERGLALEPRDDVGTPLAPAELAPADLAPADLAMVRSHAFPLLAWDLGRFFATLAHAGFERDDAGRTLERLALTDAVGRPASAWIDVATDRIARLELEDARRSPPERVTLVFESWQTVDGLGVPRVVVAHDARGAWRLELADVEIERD